MAFLFICAQLSIHNVKHFAIISTQVQENASKRMKAHYNHCRYCSRHHDRVTYKLKLQKTHAPVTINFIHSCLFHVEFEGNRSKNVCMTI